MLDRGNPELRCNCSFFTLTPQLRRYARVKSKVRREGSTLFMLGCLQGEDDPSKLRKNTLVIELMGG